MWGPGITIPGIDGDTEGYNECDHDSDEDDDDEEEWIEDKKMEPEVDSDQHDMLLTQEACDAGGMRENVHDLENISECSLVVSDCVKGKLVEHHKSFFQ